MKSGEDEDFIRKNEQSIPSYWLKCIVSRNFGASLGRSLSPDDVLFLSESRIIQRLADEAPCIIIGRCADFVLKDNPGVVRVFCCSNPETACKRGVGECRLHSCKGFVCVTSQSDSASSSSPLKNFILSPKGSRMLPFHMVFSLHFTLSSLGDGFTPRFIFLKSLWASMTDLQ